MTRLFFALLTLFFLSGPAMGENSDFRRCTIAAEAKPIFCFPAGTQERQKGSAKGVSPIKYIFTGGGKKREGF
jgi:hypothetical protein